MPEQSEKLEKWQWGKFYQVHYLLSTFSCINVKSLIITKTVVCLKIFTISDIQPPPRHCGCMLTNTCGGVASRSWSSSLQCGRMPTSTAQECSCKKGVRELRTPPPIWKSSRDVQVNPYFPNYPGTNKQGVSAATQPQLNEEVITTTWLSH